MSVGVGMLVEMREVDSMNNMHKVNIWGREFDLNVIYQNYPGEEVITNQAKTADSIPDVDFSSAKKAVEQYIMKYNSEELNGDMITNIFKYVIPKSFLIPREYDKRIFAIMCNYKFDMEHGLAVVFENEKYKSVGPQDIVL